MNITFDTATLSTEALVRIAYGLANMDGAFTRGAKHRQLQTLDKLIAEIKLRVFYDRPIIADGRVRLSDSFSNGGSLAELREIAESHRRSIAASRRVTIPVQR